MNRFSSYKRFLFFLLVKDWFIYSFKLTKIIFRPFYENIISIETMINNEFDVELLLYHTIDNNYFPPGKRIYLRINYLIISITFKLTENYDSSTDKLL